MALLTNLLSDGITKGAKKALKKAAKDTVKDALPDAVSKSSSKAISKTLRNEIADEATDAAIKKMPRNLTGAGVSSLEKNAGSTLDGVLGRSSGITLKNAKKPSLEELTGYKSLGNALEGLDMTVDDLGKGTYKGLSRRNLATVKESTREAADMLRSALEEQTGGLTKSQLPKLNRQQYYEDTIGKLKNKGGVMSYKDVPEYMKGHLVNANRGGEFNAINNDEVLRELFGENMDLNDAYAKYEDIASSDMDANKVYTPENIDLGLGMQGKAKANAIEQDFADRLAGAREIPVEKITSGKKNIAVNRPTEMVTEAVAETNSPIADFTPNIIEPKTETGGAGSGNGGGTPTATASPDYGGLGDSGFNVHLKDGGDIDIKLKQPMSKSEVKRNKAVRKLDDDWAKGLNATKKQYGEVVAKSKSAYNGYKTPAEMARLNGISLDNINETPQAVVDAFERRKLNIEKYAEDRGVNVRLDNLDLSNIEPATKATMKMQGIDPDKIKYTGVASPLEAETLYKDLRNRAAKTTDGDRAVAYNTMADYVRNQIDNTMDNLNIDFSAEMSEALGEALGQNADRRYLRGIATNKGLKFSDLRREQADWIKVGNLSGNPMKETPTINIFGIDTGAPNPFTSGADKIKEKIYERQAYGAGGAGSSAGGGAGFNGGGSGAENTINFTSPDGGRAGTLGNLLSKAKSAGMVGAGVLGGLMLGGNGGGQPTAGGQTLADVLQGNQMQQQQSQLGLMAGEGYGTDPYAGMTVGGYTYNELADGYARALQAGDASAAESIAKLMGIIEDKATATLNRQKYESSLKSSSGNNNSASAVNVLSNLYDLYNNIKGGTGPIAGNITNALNAITGGGYNTEANTYWSVSRGALGKMIKGMGDTGALSEGDQKRALQMIPNITDTREAAEQKFMALYNILSGAAQM